MKFLKQYLVVIMSAVILGSCANDYVSVIPKPDSAKLAAGEFVLSEKTIVIIKNGSEEVRKTGEYLIEKLTEATGLKLSLAKNNGEDNAESKIVLVLNEALNHLGKEGYELKITGNRINLLAHAQNGLFYAVQTLLQLLPADLLGKNKDQENAWSVPCLEIKDVPRYSWRGIHLDVGRHFFAVGFIKKYIDYLAMHKINTFHWHLTEDQGWRIEIKKYPKLTEIGSVRKETTGDGIAHGGFYSQDEIREVVDYAKSRYVTIVPEIEMPGHSVAAIAAYPELSCTGGPFAVETEWGVHKDVYCAGNEKTFAFLEDVLSEIVELFPGEFIHIGGDECPKERWQECEKCQKRIKSEGLKDEHELQSYFIKRIEKFLTGKGKRLIGWDEILEGGLAPNATVMSWRGPEGGIAAAKQGHDVVMTPTSHCYFDYYQGNPNHEPYAIGGFLPLSKVYSFEPTPNSLSADESQHILGGQANVWTEYITTPEHVEYMLTPRLAALAEVVWTRKELRDLDDFFTRIGDQLKRYEFYGVNYAKSLYNPAAVALFNPKKRELQITLKTEIRPIDIYYTTDGSEPATTSKHYSNPVKIAKTTVIKAAAFKGDEKRGSLFEQKFYIHKASGRETKLTYPYAKRYNGGGKYGLTDGIRGSKSYGDGFWQGFEFNDFEAVIDLGKTTPIHRITTGFLNNNNTWIFLPQKVEFSLSDDGQNFKVVAAYETAFPEKAQEVMVKDFSCEPEGMTAKYIKVQAKNIQYCPSWHRGAGGKAWLFVDEIIVE